MRRRSSLFIVVGALVAVAIVSSAATPGHRAAPAARLADVAVPTLVVWGEADRIGDVEYGRVLAGAIPAARFEVIDEAGHLPQIERPEALTAAISGFLADTALAGR